MHKVVVERPRGGQAWARQFPRPKRKFDDLPKYEGIRRPHARQKWFTDVLGPLRRWLYSQVGRRWDDLYSAACAVIKPDSVVRAHIKTHLLEFVLRHTFMRDGRVWCFAPHRYCGTIEIPVQQAAGRWALFYVHPETGLLCALPRERRCRWRDQEAMKRVQTQRRLTDTLLLRQLRGLWFICEVGAFPREFKSNDSPWRFDLAEGRAICRANARDLYGRDVFCFAKRQLSRRELKQHGLTNSPPPTPPGLGTGNTASPGSHLAGSWTREATVRMDISWKVEPTATRNAGGRMTKHDDYLDQPLFETTSKRRKGFPSETQVKKGLRIVHGGKLIEKLGRNDLCPCGSSRRFQELLPAFRPL